MNKWLVVILLLLPGIPAMAQKFEPTEEEIKKYGPYLQWIDSRKLPDEAAIKTLDSLYALDSNSMFLKGIMGETNARLIYDSLRTDRIPQMIEIIKSVAKLRNMPDNDEDLLYSYMQFYFLAGNYNQAEKYALQLFESTADNRMKESTLNKLLRIYSSRAHHKEALQLVHSVSFNEESWHYASNVAEVYFNNGMYDSALYFVDKSIEGKEEGNKKFFSDYVLKAKILFQKWDRTKACENIQLAEEIVKNENAEDLLRRRDQNNRYIKELLQDIEEVYALKKQYCK